MEEKHNDNDFWEDDFFEDDEVEIKKPRKFERSVSNTVIGGVCGGLGQYFNTTPNLFRAIFVLASFLGGWGLLIYLTALLLMPVNPDPDEYTGNEISVLLKADDQTIVGSMMILFGIYFLILPTGLFHLFSFMGLSTGMFFSFLLLAVGIKIIKQEESFFSALPESSENKLYKSQTDKRFMGVCGGLAEYFNIDSTLLRTAGLISVILTAGVSVLIYFIFSAALQFEPELVINEE